MSNKSKKYLVSVRVNKPLNNELEELYSMCGKSHSDVLRSVLARGIYHYKRQLLERESDAIVSHLISRDIYAYEQQILADMDTEPSNNEILDQLDIINDMLNKIDKSTQTEVKPASKKWFS